jgi:NAD(P)-dependent dehydrogenase (short-subunit alcohol dehydrogenase family)
MEPAMDYRDRQVIVTGGTGALGSAVVGALVEAGATCYVPWLHEAELERFAYTDNRQVKLFGRIDLTDETAVGQLFGDVQALWASIHVAGGFAMAPVAKTSKNDLMHLINMNFVSCFLCCSAAVKALSGSGQGGRIVNVAARHGLEWRGGAGLVACTASKAAVAALTVALSRKWSKRVFSSMRWRRP